MYGKSAAGFPRRIVCLTADTTEIAFAVGAGDRVVGVPGTTRRPEEARTRPHVGAFTTARIDRVVSLEPDLVLAFSDLQADLVRELVAAGLPVLCSNPRAFEEVLQAILVIGGALGCESRARDVVQDMRDEVKQVREYSSLWPDRPRVYFEEWFDPLITGIRWVSELIEIAGGIDIFAEFRDRRSARDRVVVPDEVMRRDPEIILASWCGKPLDPVAIASRPGWDRIAAVRAGRVHEIDGSDILAPGPSLMAGLRQMHEHIQAVQSA